MLDWDNEEYAPHLTASHTGLKNVAELLAEPEGSGSFEPDDNSDKPGLSAPVYTLEVIYVTRTYVTRHGAGRLAHECSKETVCPKMTDRTNVFNPWQERLRYGKHPIGEDFFRYIRKDLEHLKQALPHHPFSVSLYLTHLDETQGRMLFADGDRKFEDFCRYCRDNAPGLFQDIHRMNSPCTAPG
jgi:hypothetical protein